MLGFVVFILIVSVLIVSHELGHFLAARRSGVKVEKFAIGFGPPLIKLQFKETLFLICAVPLGGYIKMAGDERSERKGLRDEFYSKPPGVRAKIVFFGPLFNYFLAICIFWIAFMVGFPYLDTSVGTVLDDYPAKIAGIEQGDKITSVNGVSVTNWAEVTKVIARSEGPVAVTVDREGTTRDFTIIPKEKEVKDIFKQTRKRRIIGITASGHLKIVKENLFVAFYKGAARTIEITFLILQGLYFMIIGAVPAKEAIAGPVEIYFISSEAAKVGLIAVLSLMGSLSVSLAIVNLIPFPVLDGGHLFFLMLEKMRKKPISEKTESKLVRFGMAALLILVALVLYNDIARRFLIQK